MKIGAINIDGAKVFGIVDAGKLYPLLVEGARTSDLSDIITEAGRLEQSAEGWDLKSHQLVAPVGPLKKNIFCVGKNYVDHSREFSKSGFDNSADELPEFPIIFTKAPTTIADPDQSIKADTDPTASIDYEGELGVVIGRRCKGVKADDALDYVFGYTIVNDLTSRELQRRHAQWFIGKNIDNFCPVGPYVVTADEFGPLDDIWLRTTVNGVERQAAQLRDMVFDVRTIIATISAYCTLEPGDLIATGTPAGVGIGFNPPLYLEAGDRVSVTIDNIGELNNNIV